MKFVIMILICKFTIFVPLASGSDTVAKKIDDLMSSYHKDHKFNGSILVAKNGQVIYKKGFGFANVEWKISNTPDTRFRLASITKQFTAMAVLQLVQKGKLKLDATISEYLPYYRKDIGDKVTIHQLLSHTSGIPSYGRDKVFMQVKARNPVKVLSFVKEKCSDDLAFTPGSGFKYSNSGYYILGAIIEAVTGMNYGEVVQRNIFKPLGMRHSGYDHTQSVIPTRATGYNQLGDKFERANFVDVSVAYAAGGLYSTVEDLYKWDRALYTEKLLSKELRLKMMTPNLNDYGYGIKTGHVNLGARHSTKYMAHGGQIFGFSNYIARFVDDENFIVILCNGGKRPSQAHLQIAKMLNQVPFDTPERTVAKDALPLVSDGKLGIKPEEDVKNTSITLSREVLERYVGTYELSSRKKLTFFIEDNHLMGQPTGQKKAKLFAKSRTRFFLKVIPAELEFNLNSEGEVESVTFYQRGKAMTGKKMR